MGTDTGEIPAIAGNDPLTRIVPRRNPRALQQGILTVLGVPVSLETVTARRRRLEKKYSWSILAARLTSLYEEIMRNPRVPVEDPVERETMKNNAPAGTMRPDIES